MKLPQTSRDAYHSITLEQKKSMWAKIIKSLKKAPCGLTADQIASRLRVDHVVIARRMNELVDKKVVINTPVKRVTRTGRMAMVRMINKKYAA